MATPPRVIVVGAGFSGLVLAAQLLARTDARVTLVERSGAFGRGLAYGTGGEAYLLNVRSNRMSAFADEPDHFVRWLAENAPEDAEPQGFARRSVYGAYLSDVLRQAVAKAPGRLLRRAGEVIALTDAGERVSARLNDGAELFGDVAVVAIGNFAPNSPAETAGLAGSSRYIDNPWLAGALDPIRRSDDLILLGSGLTSADVLLDLDLRGWRGHATMLSRRGLIPHAHDERQDPVSGPPPAPAPLSQRLKAFRAEARRTPWSRLMDELRPHGQTLWLGLDDVERRRFLRHLRPWWDIHRHRLAPEAATRLDRIRARGRLTTQAARVLSAGRQGDQVLVKIRPRGETAAETLSAQWVVNCTGPQTDLSRVEDPLITALLASGAARLDALNLGLDVEGDMRLRDADGRSQPRLFALGPVTRGAFWEIVAVPDIRLQARALADALGTRGNLQDREDDRCSTPISSNTPARSERPMGDTSPCAGASPFA
jgi:uncharacterized NAD(P)/FAD-binding protein YdhS